MWSILRKELKYASFIKLGYSTKIICVMLNACSIISSVNNLFLAKYESVKNLLLSLTLSCLQSLCEHVVSDTGLHPAC